MHNFLWNIDSMLETLLFFTPKYFTMYLLRTSTFSYMPQNNDQNLEI